MFLPTHSRAFISLFAISMTLGGCALEAAPEEDEEALGEAQEALTVSAIGTYPGSGAVDATNGKKLVAVGNTLHAVYAVSGTILYATSTNGLVWSAPIVVSSGNAARNPTLGVASDGTVGVAFIRNAVNGVGAVHYAWKGSGAFQPSFKIASNGDADSGATPSLVADGMTMHVAWAHGVYARYAAFPANQSTSLASAEMVYPASGNPIRLPAVSVGPGPTGKVVRVAGVDEVYFSPTTGDLIVWIQERGASSWGYAYQQHYGFNPASDKTISISADVNPVTGDSYTVASMVTNGYSQAILIRENTKTPGLAFAQTDLYQGSAPVLSVAARTEACASRFRVMASTPNTGHGTTTYRTGSWTSGWNPTWVEASPVALPGPGRTGTALLQSFQVTGSNQTRFLYGGYETPVGSGNFQFVSASNTIQTPAPCE
jgi:hypothetical protein